MLQITNLFGEFAAADTFGSGQAARHCCVIRRLFGEADLPNGTGVIEFVLMLGHRHHDKVDLLILDEVNDVGAAFMHTAHAAAGNAGRLNDSGRTCCGNQFEAGVMKFVGCDRHLGLIAVAHREEAQPRRRQLRGRGKLTLTKRFAEVAADAHHFARGAHFRPENRVDPHELRKWEDRFLDGEVLRRLLELFNRQTLIGDLVAHHAAHGDLGELVARCFGNKRHGTRSAGIHFQHVHHRFFGVGILNGKLHVHEANHFERLGKFAGFAANFRNERRRETIGRQRAGRIAGVHAGLFNMFHDAGNSYDVSVADRINVHFNRIVEEPVEEHRFFRAYLHSLAHVFDEALGRMHDFHRTAAENVARTNDNRVTDFFGLGKRFVFRVRNTVGRLKQTELIDELLEAFAVFRAVNRVGRCADDGHAVGFEFTADFERRLTAVLHNHALGLLNFTNGEHVFERHRFEIETIGGVVVGGDRFRIAVHHDRLPPVLVKRHGGMHAAVVEFNALTNAVGTAAQHDHLFLVGRISFADAASFKG